MSSERLDQHGHCKSCGPEGCGAPVNHYLAGRESMREEAALEVAYWGEGAIAGDVRAIPIEPKEES